MANRNKAKGTAWESAVCGYLNEALDLVHEDGRFLDPTDPDNVRRQPQTGVRDVGDAWARPFVLECKAEKSYDLASYVRQAEREADAAGMPYGVAVVKRPRASVRDGYVVMSVRMFADVLRDLRAEPPR